jgi:hypothetical protein
MQFFQDKLQSYSFDYIVYCLQKGTITKDDLLSCGIPAEIIDKINKFRAFGDFYGEYIPPDVQTLRGYTDVYFWGYPDCGKTCAMAGILNAAAKNGYSSMQKNPALGCYLWLKNLFREYAFLPPPTIPAIIQYMPFQLRKPNEKNPRNVAFIESSGELLWLFLYEENMRFACFSEGHRDAFNSLKDLLSNGNRKIHFFFIGCDRGNKPDASNYTQSDYLQGIVRYFNNNSSILKNTDAIYVVVSKSDLMSCEEEKRIEFTKEYLQNNFKGFINLLKDICKQYSINAGKLPVMPFSLGKVYFRNICDFDSKCSNQIVDILTDKIKPYRKSILDIFYKK